MSIKYLRICSDLHLEAFTNIYADCLIDIFITQDDRDVESILVLAGDITSEPKQLFEFLDVCCKRFPKVYYVAGNHEWYFHDYVSYTQHINATFHNYQTLHGALTNLRFAFDEVGYEELADLGLRFIFTPLWADGGPTLVDRNRVSCGLNDFRLIKMPAFDASDDDKPLRRFSIDDMIAIHNQQKVGIEAFLKQPFVGRTVVITHHLPSRHLVSARFWPEDKSDGINGGFASNCDNLMVEYGPSLWIHGHSHDRISTSLWNTRIECNPAGYRGEWATKHNTYMRKNGSTVEVSPVFIRIADLEVDPPFPNHY